MVHISKKWIGHPVQVNFLDHCEIAGQVKPGLVDTSCFGILIKAMKTKIQVRGWSADADPDVDSKQANTDFCVVRSAITRFVPLMPVRDCLERRA